MLRTMIRSPIALIAVTLSLPLLTVGCFEDPIGSRGSDGETGDGDSGDGDPTTGDGDPTTGDGDPTTGDGDPTTGDGDPGTGDGEPGDPGPQLVSSIPADGLLDAPLDPYFLLYFDRVVDPSKATGKVFASQAGGMQVPVSVQPCPDFDPTCVAGIYPMSFVSGNGLPPDTEHQVVVGLGFEDPDGNPTTAEQVVTYKTFAYDANFFDDSSTFPNEVGGLSYDPGSQALFIVGVNSSEFYGPRVRKIPLPNGSPQPAFTVLEIAPGGGGPWTYGLDRYGNQLYVAMSYAGQVGVYASLNTNSLAEQMTLSTTSLPAPHSSLDEVWSTARSQDGRIYFAWGDFHGGINGSGIVYVDVAGGWTMFNSGQNLWGVSNDGVMITVGSVAAVEYLFASANGKIYKFRAADGMLMATYDVPASWGRDLEIDSKGRLWYGTGNGVYVYDVSSNNDIVELASRKGIRCGRMALREEGNLIHAYCVDFRGEAVISRVPIDLP
jgi:hypothetical protein